MNWQGTPNLELWLALAFVRNGGIAGVGGTSIGNFKCIPAADI